MLSIKDIVDLAKAGYSVSDVKELILLSKEDEKKEPDPDDTPGPEGASNENSPKDAKEAPSQEESKKDEEEPDYKALYEKSKKELEEAQKANRNKDRSSEDDYKSDEDKFKELVSQFIN